MGKNRISINLSINSGVDKNFGFAIIKLAVELKEKSRGETAIFVLNLC